MADLTNLQAAETVKIAGADAAGVETNFVNASGSHEMFVHDVWRTSGVEATLSLTTTAQEIKVGASKLTDRKMLILSATSLRVMIGPSTSCLTPVANGATIFLPTNIVWYAKSSSLTATLVVVECS
jgi:hypothetical protein